MPLNPPEDAPSIPLSETGTLIVVVPAAEGLVVAADSRSTTMHGEFIDGQEKVHTVATASPVVVGLSGATRFSESNPATAAAHDWSASPTYAFHCYDAVRAHLEQRPDFLLTKTSLNEVAGSLAAALEISFIRWPQKRREFRERDVCSLILCQVEADVSACGSVVVSVAADGSVARSPPMLWRYRAADGKDRLFFGSYT
jgi:hypothetical protein